MSASSVQLFVSGLRLPLFGAAALLLNLLLFYFIHEMVTNEQFRPPEIENINLVDFIRFQQEQRPEEETVEEQTAPEVITEKKDSLADTAGSCPNPA